MNRISFSVNLSALNNKGYALSKLKKFEAALECYNQSLEIKPDDKIVLVNKISAFRKTSRIEDALDLCNDLLEKNPNELTILYHKLRLLKKLNRFEESNVICNKILNIFFCRPRKRGDEDP